ncbi:hypothetical protein CPB83DRAFT_894440 [Crepidotus variabilis]|uniref:Uncharacterized protein n=1 Tax=Crepidotus variabilis TaxID=179855 RepID=A0A9P6JPD7_9AGAR|nr:hypothetical protein CPB83DRAFT_894440 [Crepidotus variabilis]
MNALVATGLAQAATGSLPQGGTHTFDTTPPEKSIGLLELLRLVGESDVLKPPPFNPNTIIYQRFEYAWANGGTEELQKLCSLYHISDTITNEELDKKIDEIFWVATLLLSATGKNGRKPRLDFFFMHLVTSSILIRPWFSHMTKQEHKAAFLRSYVFFMISLSLARGRPKIDIPLAMSYTPVVRHPNQSNETLSHRQTRLAAYSTTKISIHADVIQGALYHPESHVAKAIRSLAYFAKTLGTTSPGSVPGALRDEDGRQVETLQGIGQLDGTLFIRTAGIVLNTLEWCGHGQKQGTLRARHRISGGNIRDMGLRYSIYFQEILEIWIFLQEIWSLARSGSWDYSALGWDEAWNNED